MAFYCHCNKNLDHIEIIVISTKLIAPEILDCNYLIVLLFLSSVFSGSCAYYAHIFLDFHLCTLIFVQLCSTYALF